MHVQRSSFLLLATAIAAATVAAPGCSSTDDSDADSSEAHVEASTANPSGLAKCIAKPGEGEAMKTANFEEGFCFDLSISPISPEIASFTEGGGQTMMNDFIFDQCNMYRSVYRSGMAPELKSCIAKADKARRNAKGEITDAVDSLALYACGKLAFGVCNAAVDGRLHQKDASGKNTCERIVDALGVKTISIGMDAKGKSLAEIPFDVATCEQALSGLRSTGRAQMKACVANLAGGLDKKDVFYSCMEGLQTDVGFLTSQQEAGDVPEKICFPASESFGVPTEADCTAIAGGRGAGSFIERKCNEYRTKFAPIAADEAIKCLKESTNVDRDIYSCGTKGLKLTCQDSSLDAACRTYTDALKKVDPKANLGGAATRECRSLVPGLLPDHRTAVLACAEKRAVSFAKFGAAKFALFSCIESVGK